MPGAAELLEAGGHLGRGRHRGGGQDRARGAGALGAASIRRGVVRAEPAATQPARYIVAAIIAAGYNSQVKRILFTAAADRQRRKLTADVDKRLRAKLNTYAASGQGNVKRLKGSRDMRLRVGDWRVIFSDDGATVIVGAIGNRREIYD
jgi:mRNA interferase RelE/StbE